MSYILEALKRSQQERALGETPTLATAAQMPTEETATPKSVSWILVSVLSILLVIALLALSLLLIDEFVGKTSPPTVADRVGNTGEGAKTLPGDDDRPLAQPLSPPPVTAVPEVKPAQLEPQTSSQTALTGEPLTTEEIAVPTLPDTNKIQARGAERTQEASSQQSPDRVQQMQQEMLELKRQLAEKQRPVSTKRRDTQADSASAKSAPSAPSAPAETEIPPPIALPGPAAGLPQAIQARLPKRKVSVLAYSDQVARRFIILNTHKVVQGERTAEGLVVEQILKNGVVFNFEGHRFFEAMYR